MLTVNIRDLSRKPKQVIDEVKRTKIAVRIISQKKPQAAIVTLEDYQRLEDLKQKQSAHGLLKIADIANKLRINGPSDMSVNINEYLWDEYDK